MTYTYTRNDAAVPNLPAGAHAYVVTEEEHVVAVVASTDEPAWRWVAGRVSPLRSRFAPPFGWGRSRDAAVGELPR